MTDPKAIADAIDPRTAEVFRALGSPPGMVEVHREPLIAAADLLRATWTPRPLEEWHEDMGDMLWWKFPITEPPYLGSPLCCGHTVEAHTHQGLAARFEVGGWPGYHTHFSPIPRIEEPKP
jgi:hypothetical protein